MIDKSSKKSGSNLTDYSPTPFLFINDEFDGEEVKRQLDFMSENGIKGFFFHVRDGITQSAYGTELFFEKVKYTVEEAAKRGLKVWLYDEDAYPSGNLGGKLVIDHPELQANSLIVKKVPLDDNGIARIKLGRIKGLFGYKVSRENGKEKAEVITDCFGPVRQEWYRRDMDKAYYCDMGDLVFNHMRASTCYTEIMFETKASEGTEVYCAYLQPVFTDNRFGTQVNCLNEKSARYFIENVHERYKKHLGKYFGNVIPGIFMDEPSVGGALPYDEQIISFFNQKYGYNPENEFYKLCADYKGDYNKFRRDYVKAVGELFRINFLKPLNEWCEINGLIFTGHFAGEEDLLCQALGCNNIYRDMDYMHIKGFDIIGNNIGDYNHPALNLGAKIVASAAAQSGSKMIMAESFALNPFNFGYKGLKLISDWLFVLGINWIVPHGFHYGYSAMQRSDAGKSFFFQDPLFGEYKKYADYAEKVCRLLGSDNLYNCDLLMVLPDAGLSEEVPFPLGNNGMSPTERAKEINSRLYSATRYLFSNQIGFEVCDTETALSSEIKNGRIYIGKRSYSKVLVIAAGEVEEKVYGKLKNAIDCILYTGETNPDLKGEEFIVSEGKKQDIMYLRKENFSFIFNNSPDYVKFTFKKACNHYVYDAENGVMYSVADGNFSLNGYESLIIYFGNEKIASVKGNYSITQKKKCYLEYKENPQWVYMPKGAKKAITSYSLSVYKNGEKKFEGKVGLKRIRDVLGTRDDIYKNVQFKIPYFDTAVRESIYPVRAEFSAYIKKIAGREKILFDKGTFEGNYYFIWNDEVINSEKIEKTRVYDATNRTFSPEWKDGLNEFKVVFDNAGEFDGINGEVYIID